MDTLSKAQRSQCMSRIRGKNTKPELLVRRALHRMGYRYGLHSKGLPGKPDVVLTRHRKVVFVHGCFWHGHEGCKRASRPSSNVSFWDDKLDRNIERDQQVRAKLSTNGWKALVVWECQTRNSDSLEQLLSTFMH